MCVVKAQVYAGGRGKAGFVKLVKSADEALDAAKFMLTHRMTSKQTGPEGVPVSVLIVAPGVDIAKEYYIGITVDRGRQRAVTMIASAEGGVEIEEVAAKSPEKVLKVPLHPLLGLQGYQARELAFKLGFDRQDGHAGGRHHDEPGQGVHENRRLPGRDQSAGDHQGSGELMAIDAKISFDDNAMFRHNESSRPWKMKRRKTRWMCGPRRRT